MTYLILPSRTARAVGEMQKPEKTYTANVKLLQKWCDYDRYIESLPTYPLHSSFPDLPVGTVVEGELKPAGCDQDHCLCGYLNYEAKFCKNRIDSLYPISEPTYTKEWNEIVAGVASYDLMKNCSPSDPVSIEKWKQKVIGELSAKYDVVPKRPSEQPGKGEVDLLQQFEDFKKRQPDYNELDLYCAGYQKAMTQQQHPSPGYSIQQPDARKVLELVRNIYPLSKQTPEVSHLIGEVEKFVYNLPAHPQEGFTKEQMEGFAEWVLRETFYMTIEGWKREGLSIPSYTTSQLLEMFLQQP